MDNRVRVQHNTGRSVQNVMMSKSAEMGANIASQGTTRVLTDSVTMTASPNQVLRFFSQNRTFPQTNFNGQFEAGEGMILTHLLFSAVGEGIEPITPWGSSASFRNAYFTIKIGNTVVMKETCLGFLSGYVSLDADNSEGQVLPLESGLFIPPQIDFEVALYVDNGVDAEGAVIKCDLFGLGSLLNIKNY